MSLTLASRLARREVRRRPGRTALVTLLVMIPFVAIGIGSMMAHTSDLTPSERLVLGSGRADLEISISGMPGSRAFDPGTWISDVLGPGAQWTTVGTQWVPMIVADSGVVAGNEARDVTVAAMDLASPVNEGTVQILDGTIPSDADSVVVSSNLADLWKLRVGSRLNLERPRGSFTVVGIARSALDLRGNRIWVTRDNSVGGSLAFASEYVRVDVPGAKTGKLPDVTAKKIAIAASGGDHPGQKSDIESAFWSHANSWIQGNRFSPSAFDVFGVLAVLAFSVLAVVASAAFATSARRQLTTIGQLTANGASMRDVRMALALQGFWSGLTAVLIGLVPIGWFAASGQGIAEMVSGHAVVSIEWSPRTLAWTALVALVSSTLSAWVPARTASRVSVLDALAGRRAERVAPRVYAGAGLVLFAAGVGLEILAATGARQSEEPGGTNVFFYAAFAGGLAILGSIGLLGPVLVRVFDILGSRSSGSMRLASRGLARNRTRSSAVVVSIAAFGALGASVSTGYVFSHSSENVWFPYDQVREIQISCPSSMETFLDCGIADNPGSMSRAVDRIVGSGATSFPLRWATYDPARPFDLSVVDGYRYVSRPARVSSPALLDSMGISAQDRRALEKFGIISLMTPADIAPNDRIAGGDTSVTAVFLRENGRSEFPSSLLTSPSRWVPEDEFLVTEAFARRNGMRVFMAGRLVTSPRALTENQVARLGVLIGSYQVADLGMSQTMFDDKGSSIQIPENFDPTRPDGAKPSPSITYNSTRPSIDPRSVQAIVAFATLVLVGFVVAVGLSLMAAEGKDERDVLVSIGSSPAVQAKIAGLRSAGLTVLGLLLAFPAGMLPTLLSARTLSTRPSASIWSQCPWLLGVLYLLLPAVMMLVSMIASAAAQALKPVRISNSAFD